MCGIAGFVTPEAYSEDAMTRRIEMMTETLYHRGPDAEGIWLGDSGVAMGHRRLSIVDLSEAGAQPMQSACGRYVIVFNGEIYNHNILRRHLEEQGAAPAWRGHSDTETLLAGIASWGLDETLRRSMGMFALALWDRRSCRLLLARDRMGEKPLYWGWAGREIVFGSELKALRVSPDFAGIICRNALYQYLRFNYVPAPRSIYLNIYKLEPGCILEVGQPVPAPSTDALRPGERHECLSIRRYWSLDNSLEEGDATVIEDESTALSMLDEALSNAVSRQMLADVSVGAFLSGGIDSSLIVSIMQAHSARPVKTFTIGFEEKSYNEAPHAAAVARHLGTDHTEMILTEEDAFEVIPHLPKLYDEPFADSSQIPTYLVSKLARSEVTVALSGDAGDELFGGYNRYLWGPKLWNRMKGLPLPLRRLLGTCLVTVPPSAWNGIGRLAGSVSPRFAVAMPSDKARKLALFMRSARTMDELYRCLVSEWEEVAIVLSGSPTPTLLDDPMPACFDDDPVGRMMMMDMRTYLPDDILCKVDRAAMGVSLETRVPFLDPRVMQIAARLSPDMRIRDGQGKWALRQLLYRHVPKELIERPKAGFGMPIGAWLRSSLRPWTESLLSRDALTEDGFFDPEMIQRIWKSHLSGRQDWSHRLWSVLMFQAWRKGG